MMDNNNNTRHCTVPDSILQTVLSIDYYTVVRPVLEKSWHKRLAKVLITPLTTKYGAVCSVANRQHVPCTTCGTRKYVDAEQNLLIGLFQYGRHKWEGRERKNTCLHDILRILRRIDKSYYSSIHKKSYCCCTATTDTHQSPNYSHTAQTLAKDLPDKNISKKEDTSGVCNIILRLCRRCCCCAVQCTVYFVSDRLSIVDGHFHTKAFETL